jgi:hypothetical protein
MESWPTNSTYPYNPPKQDSWNLQNIIILSVLPVPIVTVVVWLLVASYRQLRRPGQPDADVESKSDIVEPQPVDDCSTVFGSELDSQMTTSEDGLAFEDEIIEEPDPYLFDRIVISPPNHE